jgi:hypothetical protein
METMRVIMEVVRVPIERGYGSFFILETKLRVCRGREITLVLVEVLCGQVQAVEVLVEVVRVRRKL